MYAFTTQASEPSEKPRSVRIDGSATFTMVVSSTIMKLPKQRTMKARQRARSSTETCVVVIVSWSHLLLAVFVIAPDRGFDPIDPLPT